MLQRDRVGVLRRGSLAPTMWGTGHPGARRGREFLRATVKGLGGDGETVATDRLEGGWAHWVLPPFSLGRSRPVPRGQGRLVPLPGRLRAGPCQRWESEGDCLFHLRRQRGNMTSPSGPDPSVVGAGGGSKPPFHF